MPHFRACSARHCRAAATRVSRGIESRGDEHLARLLRQAAMDDLSPEGYRVHQLGQRVALRGRRCARRGSDGPHAAHRPRGRGDGIRLRREPGAPRRSIAGSRRALSRIRVQLYTVNHLLAMQVRTGSGAMQAVQRVVERGRGAVVEELSDVLTWTRSGLGEAEAFRRAAELTPEPSAARTYRLLAAGVERGVDLGGGLLALSSDIRDARREQMHKDAVKRRAAMLLPTIAILAPIMLLFIAAPLPSIVLGHH